MDLPTIELHRGLERIIVRTAEQVVKRGCTIHKRVDKRTAKPFGGWCSISYSAGDNARKAKSPTEKCKRHDHTLALR